MARRIWTKRPSGRNKEQQSFIARTISNVRFFTASFPFLCSPSSLKGVCLRHGTERRNQTPLQEWESTETAQAWWGSCLSQVEVIAST